MKVQLKILIFTLVMISHVKLQTTVNPLYEGFMGYKPSKPTAATPEQPPTTSTVDPYEGIDWGFLRPTTPEPTKPTEKPVWIDENCDEGSKCVHYRLCRNGKIATGGEFIINPRRDSILSQPANSCPQMHRCCELADYVKPPANECNGHYPSPSVKCGVRNKNGIGGLAVSMDNKTLYAQYAEFPWMMAILREYTNEDNETKIAYKFGGSLIHEKIVLTTAHNVQGFNRNQLIVRGGEWEMMSTNEMCAHEERRVKSISKHKLNHATYENDIALLFLDKAFTMSAFINKVCLPSKYTKFDNKACVANGWGKVKDTDQNPYQSFLKKVELAVVPKDKCFEQLSPYLEEGMDIPDSILCAGGEEGVDTCQGDGGSPLVCPMASHPDLYYQFGIVASGMGCGAKGLPGLYTDVAKQKDWIESKASEKGIFDL